MLLEMILVVLIIAGMVGILFIRNTLLSHLLKKNKNRQNSVAFQTAKNVRRYRKGKSDAGH